MVSLGEKQFVFTAKSDGRVTRREVTLGSRRGGKVEVVSGINEGETVVTEGVAKLVDGMTVNFVNPSKTGEVTK